MSSSPYGTSGRESLLADLNPAQREAVTHGTGPLLVVAGAGSGKTRVLTRRVAWLIAGGLPSRSILAITFTNKAAGVLRERLTALPGARDVWAGTFHGFGSWILRRDGERIGVGTDFTILDREDQHRLLRTLMADLELDPKHLRPGDVAAELSFRKNGGSGRQPLDLSLPDDEADFDRLARAYMERLRASNLLDFDDLLLLPLELLERDEEVRGWYARRFAHVLVDEYQDTNRVQARLLMTLTGTGRGLTVVGDPDQSIYRWRGAAVRNILDFESDYPGARTIVLEQNYRSTARILAAAEHVIERNVGRHAKRLFTIKADGARLVELQCGDAEDEADAVADTIVEWQREGFALGDVAVFYRVNAHSRAIELALRGRGIPYVVVAGVEFFQRREVKDLLAYARLVANPDDDAAFHRIVNVPRRGAGDASLKKVRRAASERGVSCFAALREGVPGLSGRAAKGMREFLAIVDDGRAAADGAVGPLLERLAERSGYRAWLEERDSADGLGQRRLENVHELIAFAHEFDQGEASGLGPFLERAALVTDQDAYEDGSGRVTLMSVHAAKGLEFPCVIVAGAEEDLFPHGRSAVDEESLEEERRLFYVAMTRAMERLAVAWAARRMTYRGLEPRRPSPFLADVPEPLRECRARRAAPGSLFGSGWLGEDRGGDEGAVRESDTPFVTGERVVHPYFGEGTLTDVQGRGAEARVTVDFVAHGTKRLLLRHARLERVS